MAVQQVAEFPTLNRATGIPHERLDELRTAAHWAREAGISRSCGEEPAGGGEAGRRRGAGPTKEGPRLVLAEHAELAKSSATEMQREIDRAHEGDKRVVGTLEAVLWQMVALNSDQAGQIALMRRALGGWPPQAAGIRGNSGRIASTLPLGYAESCS